MTILQFLGDFSDYECPLKDLSKQKETGEISKKGWSPSMKVWLNDTELLIRNRYDDVCLESIDIHVIDSHVKLDVWHTLVIGVKWYRFICLFVCLLGILLYFVSCCSSPSSSRSCSSHLHLSSFPRDSLHDGFLHVWHNGDNVIRKDHVATTMKADRDTVYQLRMGLYATDWHNQGRCQHKDKRVHLMLDKIAVARSFDLVDPDGWWYGPDGKLGVASRQESHDLE